MDRSKMKWWDKFYTFQRFSFLKNHHDAVCRVPDETGAWVEHEKVSKLVDEMQAVINALESENNALKRRLELKFV